MNLYKKSTAKLYSFLVIDTTLSSDYPLRFRIIMTINDKIRIKTNEKLQ